MPDYKQFAASFAPTAAMQRKLLRSLMNLRPPLPLDPAFLQVQDTLLKAETAAKGIVTLAELPAPEEFWAFWSRNIWWNRYVPAPYPVYDQLRQLIGGHDYFVLTTNVDHCFQKAGFAKEKLFYTQGDYGLFQCSKPCHQKTYDNEYLIRRMVTEQKNLRVPTELLPTCPVCGEPMTVNLRINATFVEDAGWQAASARYRDFLLQHQKGRVLYLELGVGRNTPGIIKYPFWQRTAQNPTSTYACLNQGEAFAPEPLKGQSICLDGDLRELLQAL